MRYAVLPLRIAGVPRSLFREDLVSRALNSLPGTLKKRAAILAEARLGIPSAELPEAGKTYTL